MIEWNDVSSWSKSEKDRTPKTWSATVGQFRLVVYRHRHYEPDQWLASCYPDVFIETVLDSKDIDSAKKEAELMLKTMCEDAIMQLTAEH